MSLVAGSLGPRYRVLGDAAAYEKWGLDPQEEQMSAGLMPGEAGYGAEAPERWGRLIRGDDAERVPTEPGDYPSFYPDVARAILEGTAPPVALADAVATLEILEAARDSAGPATAARG
jgi:predicted dehydrogenase